MQKCLAQARSALRHGPLDSEHWPTEPHIVAYAAAHRGVVRVWTGRVWLWYRSKGHCVSIKRNGVNHYDAYVKTRLYRLPASSSVEQRSSRQVDVREEVPTGLDPLGRNACMFVSLTSHCNVGVS
eukprot:4827398-Amphidinium_carterae.1